VVRVELTFEIARPPEEVFEYLTDLAKLPEWQASAVESRTDGGLAEGALIKEKRSFLGREIDTEVEVERYEPPRRLTLRAIEAPLKLTIDHVLDEDGDGTKLHVTADGKPTGALRLAGPVVESQARKELQRDFKRLKELLEE
jgi:carbon monoxide dehydrogenase subunit G